MNLFSPTKAIRQVEIGEPFVSHWSAKNLASNFLRNGVTGTALLEVQTAVKAATV